MLGRYLGTLRGLMILGLSLAMVAGGQASEKPRRIEAKQARKISALSLRFRDVVKAIDSGEFGFRVVFQEHAAVYHVEKDASTESILNALRASLGASSTVEVEVNADTLVIIDAQAVN